MGRPTTLWAAVVLLGCLTKLRDYVKTNVFLLYETFPSQAAPAFQKEAGPIPQGIVTRPVEPERFREVTP